MQARDVMITDAITVPPETPVPEIAALFLKRHISGVPVVDKDRAVLGIVSADDLVHRPELGIERHRSWWLRMFGGVEEKVRAYVKAHGSRAADVMTREIVTVTEDSSLTEIVETLDQHHIKRVPVLREGRLVGIVSRADLLRGLAPRRADGGSATLMNDGTIRERFLKDLTNVGLTSVRHLEAVVSDGVIHLSGLAETEDEIRALRVIAESIPGVRSVDMHVSLAPPTWFAE